MPEPGMQQQRRHLALYLTSDTFKARLGEASTVQLRSLSSTTTTAPIDAPTCSRRSCALVHSGRCTQIQSAACACDSVQSASGKAGAASQCSQMQIAAGADCAAGPERDEVGGGKQRQVSSAGKRASSYGTHGRIKNICVWVIECEGDGGDES